MLKPNYMHKQRLAFIYEGKLSQVSFMIAYLEMN